METTQSTDRIAKANEIKAAVEQTRPVAEWGMTANVWTSSDGGIVRVYINDKKRKCAAILNIDANCAVSGAWQPGHSLTRNEIKAALGIN